MFSSSLKLNSVMCNNLTTIESETVFRCKKMRSNLVIHLLALCVLLINVCCVSGKDISCSAIKSSPDAVHFSGLHIPDTPQSGTQLRICSPGLTCCTKEMEDQMNQVSNRQYDDLLRESLSTLSSLLKNRMKKLDDVFKQLMAKSKKDFDSMFKQTYGTIYEQNASIFLDLYEEIEKYFSTGRVDLSTTLNNFFNLLGQKMFYVMNNQYKFDEKHKSCLSEQLSELKPFKEAPEVFITQLKRSLVAFRTLTQSLGAASEVAAKMINLVPSSECYKVITKMQKCSLCQGYPDLKPCNNYCINVMKGCLAYHTELDRDWNTFTDGVNSLVLKLLDPYDIEAVVRPFYVKISEAVMNFQESGNAVSEKIFAKCGRPQMGRRRRDSPELSPSESQEVVLDSPGSGYNDQSYNPNSGRKRSNGNRNRQSNRNRDMVHRDFSVHGEEEEEDEERKEEELKTIIKDIQSKVNSTKNFWSQLSYSMCSDERFSATPKAENSCWNGTDRARYTKETVGNGISNQQDNLEVLVDDKRPNSLLNEQIYSLTNVISQLKSAFKGSDVAWFDIEDGFSSGSGSGYAPDFHGGDSHYDDEDSPEYISSGQKPVPDVPFDGGNDLNNKRIGSVDIPQTSAPPPGENEEDNGVKPLFDESKVKYNISSSGKATLTEKLTLNRALASYLLPVVVVWIGNSFTEWIQLL